ncbi:hypothetical protein DL95DRAFT_408616 [Leptodontidium sp. 2 PMI_412]|nr:hypothetical protein DL95DRAFT_408616 [Leptodontidium sp. 2 PMI_412]
MAEILGATASAITISAVAGAAFTVGGRMISLAKELAAAGEEMEDFGTDLQLFYMAVDFSLNCLDRYLKTPTLKDSPVLKNLEKTGGFELLKQKSRQTKRRIHKAWKVAKLVQSKVFILKDTFTAINWVFRKPELLALRPELEAYKTSISLIINTLGLEMKLDSIVGLSSLMKLGSPEEALLERMLREKTVEIEELKDQIRVQVKTMALSNDREEKRRRQSKTLGMPEERYEQRETLQDVLIDLGTSMIEREQVAQPGNLSPSSSLSANSSARRSSSHSSTSTVPSTSPASNSGSSIPQEEPSQRRPAGPSTNLLPKPLQVKNERHRSTSEDINRVQQQHSVSHVPSLRHKQRRIANLAPLPDPTPPVPIEEALASNQAKQVDYSSVKPTSSYLQCFNGSGNMRSESGYIAVHGERIPTTANLDPECPQNLISIALAARLGLVIEPHDAAGEDGSREVVIAFPNGEKRKSSGEVTFLWSAGISSHKPPFNVRCLVYEHGIRNLVLGRPFLDRRHRYWNGGEDKDGGEWMR